MYHPHDQTFTWILNTYQSLHLDKVSFALIHPVTYAVMESISLAQNNQESSSDSANRNIRDFTIAHSHVIR